MKTLSHVRLSNFLKSGSRLVVSHNGKTDKWAAIIISEDDVPEWLSIKEDLDILLSSVSTRVIPVPPVLAPGDQC